MGISLSPEKMLGRLSYDSTGVCEFQVGSMLIFVEHPIDESPDKYLKYAESEVDCAYAKIAEAIEMAKKFSCQSHYEFWSEIDELELFEEVLLVFSIRFVKFEKIIYEISWNPSFCQKFAYEKTDTWKYEAKSIPKFPEENEFIFVEKLKSGKFQCKNTR